MSKGLVKEACWREEGVEVLENELRWAALQEGRCWGWGLGTPWGSLHPQQRREGSLPAQWLVSDTVVLLINSVSSEMWESHQQEGSVEEAVGAVGGVRRKCQSSKEVRT